MKKTLLSITSGLALCALTAPVVAEVSLSANVAMTTDYVWRGITQNDEEAAIQGGFDLGHESGLYGGIWGSNVNTGEGSLEIDYYAGYASELDNGLGYDVGAIAYTYPGTDDWDTEEYYLSLSYSYFSGMVSYNNDFDTYYYEVGADFEVGEGFGIGLHYGIWDDDAEDASDWKIALSKSLFELDFELAYTDTDWENNKDVSDGRVFLTVSKGWE